MTEQEKIRENTGDQGNNLQTELGKALSEQSLTTEQKVDELSKDLKNVNAGVGQLLDLFKKVLKTQEDTEDSIGKQIAENAQNALNKDKKMEYIIQQINTLMPNKDKIFHDIFSGKDGGEIEILESNGFIQKGGIREGMGRRNAKYRPNDVKYIGYENETDAKNFILYCANIVLALKSRKISIENEGGEGNEIFCKTQGFSWTIEEVKVAIKNYCYIDKNDPADVIKYIVYLYKK